MWRLLSFRLFSVVRPLQYSLMLNVMQMRKEHLKMKHTGNNYIKNSKFSQWFLYAGIGTGSCQLCKKYW